MIEMLRKLSRQDSLTGVGNRRAMIEELISQKNATGAARSGTSCLILMDLDHFKNINDRYGHLTGDDILKQFTDILKQTCGKNGKPVERTVGFSVMAAKNLWSCWNAIRWKNAGSWQKKSAPTPS